MVPPGGAAPHPRCRGRRAFLIRSVAVGIRENVARLLLRTGVLDLALRVRARAGTPRVTVFTHHHVFEPDGRYAFDPEVADATPEQFRRRVEGVARRFSVIGVDDLCRGLDGAPLPRNPALITFDDGYRSCLEVAVPVLRRAGVPAVFFIATSFVEERRLYWWDRIAYVVAQARAPLRLAYPRALELDPRAPGAGDALNRVVKNTPGLDVERFLGHLAEAARVPWDAALERRLTDDLIMSWDQVRALRDAGMDVESHTRRHRVLQTLPAEALADELAGSKADLERELGRRVRAIAYPVGRAIAHLAPLRAAVAAAGYEVGFTNATGSAVLGPGLDRLDFPRIAVDRGTSEAMLVGQMAIPKLGYRPRRPGAEPR